MSRPILPNVFQNPPFAAQQPVQSPGGPNAPQTPIKSEPATASPAGGSGTKPTYAKRGKITIVACVPCRKRKTKCNGARPACSQCLSRGGNCHYDMTDDQRKLTYLRDTVEQLQERTGTFEGLLHTMQTASEEEAAEIFRRLRSGGSVHQVAEQVQAGRMLSGVGRQSEALSEFSPESSASASSSAQHLRQYDRLMNIIAESEPDQSTDIVRRIRNREDPATIIHAAQHGTINSQSLVQDAGGSPQSLEGDFSRREQTFGMVKGAESFAAHAATNLSSEFVSSFTREPWTTATQDQELIEHLLTMYFTWQHNFFQSFPEKLFREDMAAGRTKYCSSMLVNAICAAGCFLSERNLVSDEADGGRGLVSLFFDEAVKQVDSKIETSSICTTAALGLLSYVEGTRGHLSSSWMLSGRGALTALDLNLHLKRRRRNISETEEEKDEILNEESARIHAFWGCFHVDQTTCFTLGRLPVINSNGVTLELPEVNDSEDNDVWEAKATGAAMERVVPDRPGATSTTFHQCSLLSQLVNMTMLMFFAPTVPLSGPLLLEEYSKYLRWKENLPKIIASTEEAPPHVLTTHMYYNAAVLLLFRPFLKATISNSKVLPSEVARQSANAISEIWSQYRELYGLQGVYMFQVQCLLTACTIHIVNLPSISASKYLTQACNTFRELIPRNEWARSSLSILRGLAQKWALILPLEVEEAMYQDQQRQANPISGANQQPTDQHREMRTASSQINTGSTRTIAYDYPNPFSYEHAQGSTNTDATGPELFQQGSSAKRDAGASNDLQRAGSQKRQRVLSPQQQQQQQQLMQHRIEQRLPPPSAAMQQRMQAQQQLQQKQGQAPQANMAIDPALQSTSPPTQPTQLALPTLQAQTSQVDHATASTSSSQVTASNFLYTPFSNQQAPLLVPVRSSLPVTSGATDQTQRQISAAQSQSAEVASDLTSEKPVLTSSTQTSTDIQEVQVDEQEAPKSTQQGQKGKVVGGSTNSSGREMVSKKEDQIGGLQESVEGLNFGDDWRDPFMGYLGQEEGGV